MSRIVRAPTPLTCPSCALVSVRAPHYCPGCGYDYWRSAAGLTVVPPLAAPASPAADGRLSAALMVAGLLGLLTTAIITAVVVLSGPEQEPTRIANTLPSRGPEDFLIMRFWSEARSPYAAFTLTSQATVRQVEPPGPDVVSSDSMVLHGDDWIVDSTVVSGAETIQGSFAEVDGVYYERVGPDATWVRVEVVGDIGSASPFARISAVTEIDYAGVETVGGTELHRLLVTKWLGGSGRDFRLLGFDRVAARENRLEIWVNDDGVPIRARQDATVAVVEGGQTYTFTIEAEMTFGDWGTVEPIGPPTNMEDTSVQGTIGAPPVPRTRSRPSAWPRPLPSARRRARSRAARAPRRTHLPQTS